MKKITKIAALAAVAALVLTFAACGVKGEDNGAADTIGKKYVAAFKSSKETDPAKLANELAGLKIFDSEMALTDVKEGYLDGFNAAIAGFTKGTKFAPYIGSIPFIGYVFETDDVKLLLDQLNATADTRWNICTEADEVVSASRDGLVFFLMCSNEE